MIVFDKKLTEEQRLAVGRYLNKKYGLATNGPTGAAGLSCQSATPYEIAISWPPVTNATMYVLTRSGDGASATLLTANNQVTNFLDTISSDEPITYTLTARNYQGDASTSVVTPLMEFTSPSPEAVYYTGTAIPITLTPYSTGFGGFGGYTFAPSKVELFANGQLYLTQTNSPWGFTVTNTGPTRWHFQAKAYDAAGNSRYTGTLGVNVITFVDSDGDGISDGYDWFPFDPTQWAAPTSDPNDHTAPIITITAP